MNFSYKSQSEDITNKCEQEAKKKEIGEEKIQRKTNGEQRRQHSSNN